MLGGVQQAGDFDVYSEQGRSPKPRNPNLGYDFWSIKNTTSYKSEYKIIKNVYNIKNFVIQFRDFQKPKVLSFKE